MSGIRDQMNNKTKSLFVGYNKNRSNRKNDGFADIDDISLVKKPFYQSKDGSSYTGQWNQKNMRDGYGIQFYKNGEKY